MKILNKKKEDALIVLIFVDLLFLTNVNLPLLPTMPISLPIVIIYCILHPSIIRQNEVFRPFLLFSLVLTISVMFGTLFGPKTTILGSQLVSVFEFNFKRTLQIVVLFFYLFFIRSININKYITKIIMTVFVIWYLFLGLLSTVNLSMYFNIHNFIYGETITKADYYLNYESLNVFRYRYIFLDANTSIYFFLLVTFYLLSQKNNKMLFNLFIHLSNLIAVFLAQSSGAFLSIIVFYLFYFGRMPFSQMKVTYNKNQVLVNILTFATITTIVLIIIMIQATNFGINIFDIDFISSGYNRITNNDGGGRLEKIFFHV